MELSNNFEYWKTLIQKIGYKWFDEDKPYNLNLIGVRAALQTNQFNDKMVCLYSDNRKYKSIAIWDITTDPGTYWLEHPMASRGTAILVPGQYQGAWKLSKHRGEYTALCQCKPVKVYRDKNKNKIAEWDSREVDDGIYGINIHRANESRKSKMVDKWSAGCQVFDYFVNFNKFISLCEKQSELYGNTFTYTLIEEEDLKLVGNS